MNTLLRKAVKSVMIGFLKIFYHMIGADRIYKAHLFRNIEDIPSDVRYCLIPGARLFENDTLTPMLEKRLNAAIRLYEKRPGITFILSGDGSKRISNDVKAMQTYLKTRGAIPEEQLLPDNEGFTTLDTMRHISAEVNEAGFILLTSEFHMPRCVYICHRLGLKPYALHIPGSYSKARSWYRLRELSALVKDWYVLRFGTSAPHRGIAFYLAMVSGKLLSSVLRLTGRADSYHPGKLALQICPYTLTLITREVPISLVAGTRNKAEVCRLLQKQRNDGSRVSSGTAEEGTLFDIATILISQYHFIRNKQRKSYIFMCKETEFFKITKQLPSAKLQLYITGLDSDENSDLGPELTRSYILCGIDQVPSAELYLNQSTFSLSAMKKEFPNNIFLFSFEENNLRILR